MKAGILFLTLTLTTMAHAAQYNCTLRGGDQNGPAVATYSVDTATEENKFVDLGGGSAVGCVIFRSTPELLGCGIAGATPGNADTVQFSDFAVTDNGASILKLDTSAMGQHTNLTCLKQD